MFDDFEFDPMIMLYAGAGLVIGLIMMKFSGEAVKPLWKVLSVVATTAGAFILGYIQINKG